MKAKLTEAYSELSETFLFFPLISQLSNPKNVIKTIELRLKVWTIF